MKLISSLALISIFIGASAHSQSVVQSGQVTPTHIVSWTTNGVVQDGGTALSPSVTSLGILGTGTPFCISDALSSAPGGYHQMCFGANLGGTQGVITYNAYNGAAQLPLNFVINGVTTSFGGPGWLSAAIDQQFGSAPGDILCRSLTSWSALTPSTSGYLLQTNGSTGCPSWVTSGMIIPPTVRIINSGTTDTAVTTDGTVAWNSSNAANKTETIYACSGGNQGKTLIIKDEIGTAQTYSITITPVSGTIDGNSSVALFFKNQAITLQCDGGTNWMVI